MDSNCTLNGWRLFLAGFQCIFDRFPNVFKKHSKSIQKALDIDPKRIEILPETSETHSKCIRQADIPTTRQHPDGKTIPDRWTISPGSDVFLIPQRLDKIPMTRQYPDSKTIPDRWTIYPGSDVFFDSPKARQHPED